MKILSKKTLLLTKLILLTIFIISTLVIIFNFIYKSMFNILFTIGNIDHHGLDVIWYIIQIIVAIVCLCAIVGAIVDLSFSIFNKKQTKKEKEEE